MDRIEKCYTSAKILNGDVRGAKAGLADWMAEEAIERAEVADEV